MLLGSSQLGSRHKMTGTQSGVLKRFFFFFFVSSPATHPFVTRDKSIPDSRAHRVTVPARPLYLERPWRDSGVRERVQVKGAAAPQLEPSLLPRATLTASTYLLFNTSSPHGKGTRRTTLRLPCRGVQEQKASVNNLIRCCMSTLGYRRV